MNPPACSTKRVRHEHKSQKHVKFGEVSFLLYYEYDKSDTTYASTQIVLEIMCSIYKNSKIFIILLKSNSDIFSQQSCSFKKQVHLLQYHLEHFGKHFHQLQLLFIRRMV
ncbi:hypothetical protein CEXT_109911 [Caerostris extrusa]|uniref:Uncharacterized protein n=1 Tax=Caerostris extrusa TaxID=172846 RepID=A0AAV4XH09_CAEEX|nr:hypothetical protein CEXT_109911 [Caerostris extrusa]